MFFRESVYFIFFFLIFCTERVKLLGNHHFVPEPLGEYPEWRTRPLWSAGNYTQKLCDTYNLLSLFRGHRLMALYTDEGSKYDFYKRFSTAGGCVFEVLLETRRRGDNCEKWRRCLYAVYWENGRNGRRKKRIVGAEYWDFSWFLTGWRRRGQLSSLITISFLILWFFRSNIIFLWIFHFPQKLTSKSEEVDEVCSWKCKGRKILNALHVCKPFTGI